MDDISMTESDDTTMATIDFRPILDDCFRDKQDLGRILGPYSANEFAQRWWRKRPAEYLRRSSRGQGHRHGPFEHAHEDDAVMAKITEDLTINRLAFSPQPEWVKLQLYWFFNLLNGLHKLLHCCRWGDVWGDWLDVSNRGEDYVHPGEFKADGIILIAILASDGGIELVKHHPYPLCGPGAHWEDVNSLLDHCFFRHGFPPAQLSGRRRRLWIRVGQVGKQYVTVLKKYRPSQFLALTSSAVHVRYPERPYIDSDLGGRHSPTDADSGFVEPERICMGSGPCTGFFRDSLMSRLKIMVNNVWDWHITRGQSACLCRWEFIEKAVEFAGDPKTNGHYQLPTPFKSTDARIISNILRHGGCPKKIRPGCTLGPLHGEGWMSLPHMLDMKWGYNFWNYETDWVWKEDGTGTLEPDRFDDWPDSSRPEVDIAEFTLPPEQPPSLGIAEVDGLPLLFGDCSADEDDGDACEDSNEAHAQNTALTGLS